MTIDTKSQRGKTVSEQVTTCNLRLLHCLDDSSGQEGGMHVWNVTPGDTDGDSLLLGATGCALPLNYNRWRWRASMHVCEGAEEYECESTPASFTLICLQGQPDTCQCSDACGMRVCTGVMWDWTLLLSKINVQGTIQCGVSACLPEIGGLLRGLICNCCSCRGTIWRQGTCQQRVYNDAC